MAITIQMIEEKEFKRKLNGYDPEEVNLFLDEICDEMEAMQDQIASLNAQLRSQSMPQPPMFGAVPEPTQRVPAVQVQPVQETPAAPRNTVRDEYSESAQKLLAKAQELYDQMVIDAKKEAEGIITGARAKAESDIEDLERRKEQVQEQIRMIKSAAKDYRNRFQRLLEDQAHVMNSESALFDEEEE